MSRVLSLPGWNVRGARRILSPVLVLVAWEVATVWGIIDPYFLPPVHVIIQSFWQLLTSGIIIADIGHSFFRLLAGYGLGASTGILLGVITARHRLFGDLLDPLVQALRPISPIALLPLTIVYLGIGHFQKIAIIWYSTFFPVFINTFFGVRGVDPVLVMAAKTLGASRNTDMLRQVVLPAAMPHIFSGLRVSLGISFIVIIAAEMVAAQSGLGFRILDAERIFRLDVVYVGILVISALGLLVDAVFMRVRRGLLPWYREQE